MISPPTVFSTGHSPSMHVDMEVMMWWMEVQSIHLLINPRRVGGLGYSSLSVCLCVCAHFGLPGDLGITICT